MARLRMLSSWNTGAAVCLQPVAQGCGHVPVGKAADPETIPDALVAQVRLLDLVGIARQQGCVFGLVDLPGGIRVGLALIGADLQDKSAGCGGRRLSHGRRYSG